MQVAFGVPEHGWIQVEVGAAGDSRSAFVSDVPVDTLAELVGALHRIAAGSSREQIEWSLEPATWRWDFHAVGDTLELRVDGPNGDPLALRAPRVEGLLALTRALTRLESAAAWNRDDATELVWSWAFPSDGLAKLREIVSDA